MQFVLSGSCYNCSSVTNTFAVLDADTLFILQQAQLHKMTILTLGRKSSNNASFVPYCINLNVLAFSVSWY